MLSTVLRSSTSSLRAVTASARVGTASSSITSPALTRFISSTPRLLSAEGASSGQYENILVSSPQPGVTLVTLNRPKALNALNSALFHELNDATEKADNDPSVNAIVITGSEKAFAGESELRSQAKFELVTEGSERSDRWRVRRLASFQSQR